MKTFTIKWSVAHAQCEAMQRGENITNEEAEKVIDLVHQNYDSDVGVTWQTIWMYVQRVIEERP